MQLELTLTELQNLQWKVEVLKNEKWKSTDHILKLNRMMDEFEGSLAKEKGEMAL